MKLLKLLFIFESLVYGLCFNEYESYLNNLTVGLNLINRKNDFEERNIEYKSSEEGERKFFFSTLTWCLFSVVMFRRYSRGSETESSVPTIRFYGAQQRLNAVSKRFP